MGLSVALPRLTSGSRLSTTPIHQIQHTDLTFQMGRARGLHDSGSRLTNSVFQEIVATVPISNIQYTWRLIETVSTGTIVGN